MSEQHEGFLGLLRQPSRVERLKYYASWIPLWIGLVMILVDIWWFYLDIRWLITGTVPAEYGVKGQDMTVGSSIAFDFLFLAVPIALGRWSYYLLVTNASFPGPWVGQVTTGKPQAKQPPVARQRWQLPRRSPKLVEQVHPNVELRLDQPVALADLLRQISERDRQQRRREIVLLLVGAMLGLLTNVIAVPLIKLFRFGG